MSTPNSASPFVDAPVPWGCNGEAFWFVGYFSSKKGKYPPPAAFGSIERESSFSDAQGTGDYHGGLASLMLIRYKETPVGVYSYIKFHMLWSPFDIHPIRPL